MTYLYFYIEGAREPNDPDPLWKVDTVISKLENFSKICQESSEQKDVEPKQEK